MTTIKLALQNAAEKLRNAEIEFPLMEAQILLAHLHNADRLSLHVRSNETLSETITGEFLKLVDLRCNHVPIAYLTGSKEFLSLNFFVDPRVLIPRPDTEILAEEAIRLASALHHPHLLDLCCGSGCIGLSVAHNVPDATVTLSDISQGALDVAKINAESLRLLPRVDFVQSDLFSDLADHQFDLIVSNPPYISDSEMAELSSDILRNEPHNALRGGQDGLDFYRKIAAQAPRHLKNTGFLLLEIGALQANEVSELLTADYREIRILKDYAGQDRVVCARID